MEGEEETPLMNLVFIFSTVRQEVGERGPPPVRVSQKDIFQLFLSVWSPQCGRFLLFNSFLTIIINNNNNSNDENNRTSFANDGDKLDASDRAQGMNRTERRARSISEGLTRRGGRGHMTRPFSSLIGWL